MRIHIKQVKARKPYYCGMCGDIISKGEHCSVASWQDENGYHKTLRTCLVHNWKSINEHVNCLQGNPFA